jgi:hypothetical protein
MAGLVPATHVFPAAMFLDVDARDKPGHDDITDSAISPYIPRYAACTCLLLASSALVPCMMTLPLSST